MIVRIMRQEQSERNTKGIQKMRTKESIRKIRGNGKEMKKTKKKQIKILKDG